ncbi:MAG: hypothetical protein ABEJ65_07020 [bacterium]
MKSFKSGVIVVILIVTAGCGTSDVGIKKLPNDFRWYRDKSLNIRLGVPKQWSVAQSLSEKQSNNTTLLEIEPGRDGVNCSVFSPQAREDKSTSLKKYVKNYKSEYEQSVKTVQWTSQSRIIVNGIPSVRLESKMNVSVGRSRKLPMKAFTFVYQDAENPPFVIQCINLERNFGQTRESFSTIMRSFRFLA